MLRKAHESSASDHELLKELFAEPVERFTLPNGLRVLFKPDTSAPVVSVQVWVATGSIHEGALVGSGLSHFVEHMLFKGTERRDYAAIASDVHAAGGHMNAYTTFDHTTYYVDVPSEGAEVAFDVLADMALCSRIPEAEFASERDVILREIDMGMDDPDRRLMQALFSTAFSQHPYRFPIIGERPLFERITHSELQDYYTTRYAPNNLTLIVAGNLGTDEVRALAEKHFGQGTMRRVPPPLVVAEPRQMASRDIRETGDFQIARGMLAYKIPSARQPEAPALDLLANVLGSGDSSILWQRLREEQQLVHHIEASAWNPGEAGLFWISYICDADKREAAEAGIEAEIERLHETLLPPAALAKGRRQAIVGEVNTRRSMSGQASRLGAAEVVLGEPAYARTYFERLAEATPESLREVCREYLVESGRTRATLEPLSANKTGPGASARKELPEFTTHELGNGVRVLLQPRKGLPKVHLRTVFLGGPLYEEPGMRGASELLSTLLTRDTALRSAAEVAAAIDSAGGTMHEFAGNNTLGLALEGLSSDTPLLLDLMEQALLAPAFREDTFLRERDSQVADILEEDDEILEYGRRRLRQRFFGEYPFRDESVGTAEALNKMTVNDLRLHWEKLLRGGGLAVAVAGDFDADTLLGELERILGGIEAGRAATVGSAYTGPAETGAVELHLPREQAVLLQGFPDVGITHEDFLAGDLCNEILSGMSSQLFTRVREEKGMAYFVGAGRTVGLETSLFTLYAGTAPDLAEAVYAEFNAELERLRTGRFLPGEVERCRNRLKAQRVLGQQSPGARAMDAALNVLYGFPANHTRTYSERIDAVTPEQVQAFVQRWLDAAQSLRLTVRPEPK